MVVQDGGKIVTDDVAHEPARFAVLIDEIDIGDIELDDIRPALGPGMPGMGSSACASSASGKARTKQTAMREIRIPHMVSASFFLFLRCGGLHRQVSDVG
jgi:hypothetical protein